ncbi:CotH kinase family protein [Chloroflexi bacterium TSY]|nr:CotH kinase family protein [Chloroflexi bacterium TSY]
MLFWTTFNPLPTIASTLTSTNAAAQTPLDQVVAPTFSHERGFYPNQFFLELSTVTPNAQIRYTTDGSAPSAQNGVLYGRSIFIGTSAVIRAIAYQPSGKLRPSEIATHTFLFIEDVMRQQSGRSGYPFTWSDLPADYEMDPEVVLDPAYTQAVRDGLTAIPSLALSIDPVDLFDPERGIYEHPQMEDLAWERPVGVELLEPDSTKGKGFQIDAGIRLHGRASREAENSPKHSFRLIFRSRYGSSDLLYPLFKHTESATGNATDRFDTLILRAGYNRTWIHPASSQRQIAQYIRDLWAMDSQRAMGWISTHGLSVHLYINGLYWGLYTVHEQPTASFLAAYLGGPKEQYDVLNSGDVVEGDGAEWEALMALARAGLADDASYRAIQRYIDVVNLADYMILNHYMGNRDWDRKNWYAARRREQDAPFRLYVWDSESILTNIEEDVVGRVLAEKPTFFFQQLSQNAEFRILFADRIQHHLFGDGALTPAASQARYATLVGKIEDAVVAESARWGDYRRDLHPYQSPPFELYTRDLHWMAEQHRLTTLYFPQCTNILLDQYRRRGLYPSLVAPHFNPPGGTVEGGLELVISNPNGATGTIIYTLDGSDPRAYGGVGSPTSIQVESQARVRLTQTTLVKARVFDQSTNEWSPLHQASFFPASDQSASMLTKLKISEVMYNPSDGEEFEYVELHNAGETHLDIGGTRLTSGIEHLIPAGQRMIPGEALVIAKNPEAFRRKYGFAPGNRVGYKGNLSNRGETVGLTDLRGEEFLRITYSDSALTHVLADGGGYSLVQPLASQAGADSDGWHVSLARNGSPGQPDTVGRSGSPILFNEVALQPLPTTSSFVELYNQTPNALSDPIRYLDCTLRLSPNFPTTARICRSIREQHTLSLVCRCCWAPYGSWRGCSI